MLTKVEIAGVSKLVQHIAGISDYSQIHILGRTCPFETKFEGESTFSDHLVSQEVEHPSEKTFKD